VVFPEALIPGSMVLRVEVESPPEANVLTIKPETVTLKISETRKLKIKP